MHFRHTKIVATIGPQSSTYAQLKQLCRAGMNIARLNMSHGDHERDSEIISHLRRLRKEGFSVSIMVDIKGPQIRTGDLADPMTLKKGDRIRLTVDSDARNNEKTVWVDYDSLPKDLKVGDMVLVDNGLLKLQVVEKHDLSVECRCLNKFTLTSRRHINLPQQKLKLPSLTKKDMDDITFALEHDVDFLALSFVRRAKDVSHVQAMLAKKGSSMKVVAKIETQEAVDNLSAIIDVSDGVMIARGDLGAELPYYEVPLLQKKIIEMCNEVNTPVIVATHILESMIEHPTPTRAEVSDLSYAVMQRTDAVMLSGETTIGEYPVESVKTMVRVIDRTENELLNDDGVYLHDNNGIKEEVSEAACVMAVNLDAKAIIVFTHSGHMALLASRCRCRIPIFAFSRTPGVDHHTSLAWGVSSFHYKSSDNPEKKIRTAFDILLKNKFVSRGNTVVVVSDVLTSDKEKVPSVQIRTI